MNTTTQPIDRTMYEVCAYEANGHTVKARIDTIGIEMDGFSGYVTEIAPPINDFQVAVVKSLGGAVTNSLGIGHSTILFSSQNARNLFPIPEKAENINGSTIGKAFLDIFFNNNSSIG